MITIQYTEDDVRSLNEKLAEFARTLSSGECALLVDVFRRAMRDREEVVGHDAARNAATATAPQSTSQDPGAALSWFTDYMEYLPLPEPAK